MTYKWTFNNTLESIVELASIESLAREADEPYPSPVYSNSIHQQGHHYGKHSHHRHSADQPPPTPEPRGMNPSHVYPYRVDSFQHFGTVTCSAQSPIGESGPCLYHIMAAELPDPVQSCTGYNSTANSVQVSCVPGKDGGIQQYFHIEVIDEQNRSMLYNTSFKSADFTLKRLPSDTTFKIKVSAYNLQGSSSAYRFRCRTLPAPLLRTGECTYRFNT